MANIIRNLKMVDYSSKKTQKVYAIYTIANLIVAVILMIISVKRYDKIKKIDDEEDIFEEEDSKQFDLETAKIAEKNMNMWLGYSIITWVTGMIALFKLDYTTIGEWWDKHFSK